MEQDKSTEKNKNTEKKDNQAKQTKAQQTKAQQTKAQETKAQEKEKMSSTKSKKENKTIDGLLEKGKKLFFSTAKNLQKNRPKYSKYLKEVYDTASSYSKAGLKQVDVQIITAKKKIQLEKLGQKIYQLHKDNKMPLDNTELQSILKTIKKLEDDQEKAKKSYKAALKKKS